MDIVFCQTHLKIGKRREGSIARRSYRRFDFKLSNHSILPKWICVFLLVFLKGKKFFLEITAVHKVPPVRRFVSEKRYRPKFESSIKHNKNRSDNR